ncbi:PhnD [Desulforapulum autotrophicum HRM2]|uniref:PhnD n=1 Tax=Desulforapulum autotrophicum (strain ATCC 43914 / DSM 3382 / VKM B-1955 / HRM2) TaxID=177437 RepID=C0QAE6_DESAH|nr:PhnD [Desulforapulum autotrophicum HRM2]
MVCLFFVLGCEDQPSATKVDLSLTEEVIPTVEPDSISYAYLPQYSHTVSHTRHNALIKYLCVETGLNIRQIFPDTFEQHMKMVGEKKVDISFSNPFVYVKIAGRYGARAFARSIEGDNRKTFRGQIICRRDNAAITALADCSGKRWIAVDATSAGGFLFPLGLFLDNGITKSDFSEIAFAPGPGGKQEKVILSVFAGKYDIGTIREGALAVVAGKIDLNKIRVVAMTPHFPGWVYAARKDLDVTIVKKVGQALERLDIHDEAHRSILEAAHFVGVIPGCDSDFDSVRALAARIKE